MKVGESRNEVFHIMLRDWIWNAGNCLERKGPSLSVSTRENGKNQICLLERFLWPQYKWTWVGGGAGKEMRKQLQLSREQISKRGEAWRCNRNDEKSLTEKEKKNISRDCDKEKYYSRVVQGHSLQGQNTLHTSTTWVMQNFSKSPRVSPGVSTPLVLYLAPPTWTITGHRRDDPKSSPKRLN